MEETLLVRFNFYSTIVSSVRATIFIHSSNTPIADDCRRRRRLSRVGQGGYCARLSARQMANVCAPVIQAMKSSWEYSSLAAPSLFLVLYTLASLGRTSWWQSVRVAKLLPNWLYELDCSVHVFWSLGDCVQERMCANSELDQLIERRRNPAYAEKSTKTCK